MTYDWQLVSFELLLTLSKKGFLFSLHMTEKRKKEKKFSPFERIDDLTCWWYFIFTLQTNLLQLYRKLTYFILKKYHPVFIWQTFLFFHVLYIFLYSNSFSFSFSEKIFILLTRTLFLFFFSLLGKTSVNFLCYFDNTYQINLICEKIYICVKILFTKNLIY